MCWLVVCLVVDGLLMDCLFVGWLSFCLLSGFVFWWVDCLLVGRLVANCFGGLCSLVSCLLVVDCFGGFWFAGWLFVGEVVDLRQWVCFGFV